MSLRWNNDILSANPLGFWKLGDIGSTVVDSSGNNQNLAYGSGVTKGLTGPFPGATGAIGCSASSGETFGNFACSLVNNWCMGIWTYSTVLQNNTVPLYVGDSAGNGFGLLTYADGMGALAGGLSLYDIGVAVPLNRWNLWILQCANTGWSLSLNGGNFAGGQAISPNSPTQTVAIGSTTNATNNWLGSLSNAFVLNGVISSTQAAQWYADALAPIVTPNFHGNFGGMRGGFQFARDTLRRLARPRMRKLCLPRIEVCY